MKISGVRGADCSNIYSRLKGGGSTKGRPRWLVTYVDRLREPIGPDTAQDDHFLQVVELVGPLPRHAGCFGGFVHEKCLPLLSGLLERRNQALQRL